MKDLKDNHWLWKWMTDQEFKAMNDEWETLPVLEYEAVKKIEIKHTKNAKKRMDDECLRITRKAYSKFNL